MKKFRLLLITILIATACVPFLFNANLKVYADDDSSVETGIFLPTSYLQYYNLDNPFAICRYKDDEGEFVAISHRKGLVIYKNEKFETIDIDLNDTAVTVLQRYGNYLFYLYDSKVNYIDITNFESDDWVAKSKIMTETETLSDNTTSTTNLISSSAFSIFGDEIVCHTSDNIYRYSITTDLLGNLTAIKTSGVEQKKTSMLHLSKNGLVYFSKSDESGIYVWNGSVVGVFDPLAENVRTITENEDGDTIYYSCPKGIFSLNSATGHRSTITLSTDYTHDSDLGSIYSPQGICLLNDKLWAVDNSINAVQEIDLLTNEFTEFAITTNSKAVNRLSDKVKDIAIDKDKIYALDEGRIVVVNDINKVDRTYNRINLHSPVDKFSAGNGYICYSTGKTVNLCKISETDDENIFELSENLSTSLVDTGEVMDICYSEGVFYVISSTLIDNVSHPIIFKIDLNEETIILKEILSLGTHQGSALQITADVFGTIYYCATNSGNYEYFSFDGVNPPKKLATKIGSNSLKNLQTDFDGKLYCLYENNEIEIIDGQNLYSRTIQTSDNLGEINPAKSMCLSCDSQTAYFIFEGLILKSTDSLDLNISTPHTIDIPDGFSLSYDENQQFARVKEGSKLFQVDLSNLSNEHFKFVDYGEAESSSTDYAVKILSDKYSLLIKGDTSAVARNSDILEYFTFDKISQNKYAVVEFSPYSIPVLEEDYIVDNTVQKFNLIEIVGEITFNGIEYNVIKNGDAFGYIPKTFFVDKVLVDGGNSTVMDAYVYQKGGIIVYDENGLEIGKIDKKTKVTILAINPQNMAIVFGDRIGYISVDSIVSNSRDDVMKSVAIIIAFLSICITSLFLEKKYLFKN